MYTLDFNYNNYIKNVCPCEAPVMHIVHVSALSHLGVVHQGPLSKQQEERTLKHYTWIVIKSAYIYIYMKERR